MANPLDTFIWGQGGRKLTPEQVERERRVAEALLAKGIDTSPVGHWSQGAARVANALAGSVRRGRADRAEAAGQEGATSAFETLMGGVGSGSQTPAYGASTAPGDAMASYREGIAGIESGGNYQAIGPTHPKMGRALGKYQIMESNIGPWSREVLGREVTPDEFLANDALQDAIFDGKFGEYVQQYGPEGAAQAWLGGPGGVGKTDRKDVLGTSIGNYGQRFMASLGADGLSSPAPGSGGGGGVSSPPSTLMAYAPPGQAVADAMRTAGIPADPMNSATLGAQPLSPAEAAQAGPFPAAPGAPQGGQGGIDMNALSAVMSNPWASDGQKRIAAAILQQHLQQQDPMRALEMERAQLELDALRNPQGDPFTLSPGQTRYDAQGNPIAEGGTGVDAPTVQTIYDPDTGHEQKVQWNPATSEWEPLGGTKLPSGMSIRTNPDGTVELVQGPGAGKALTEGQSKDTVYATRAEGALPTLDEFGNALTSPWDRAVEGDPTGVLRGTQTPEFQKAQQAGNEFLQAILRKDTGAAITSSEMDEYGRTYLPFPGDGPEVLAQKKQSRRRALEALKAGMPPAAILAQEKALLSSGGTAPKGDRVNPERFGGKTKSGVTWSVE